MDIDSQSLQFKRFYDHIFGDPRNYYYDGIPEHIYTNLSAEEKRQAKDLLLAAMDEGAPDERVVKAVGRFRILEALPMLHDLFAEKNAIQTRLHAAWALFRIEGDPRYADLFIEFIKETPQAEPGFARRDAIRRLSDFGKYPKSVELLLELKDAVGIYSIFRGNPVISEFIDINDPKKARRNWKRISREVRAALEKER